ncbi:DNA helicase RecQ [Haloimpatiens sp. FM7315]|uniref:DNA helicase RecQ n=1 Tax=Haloimpatiens sp. FM7315 TaxID=3298609 RepID=UPI00370A6922
MFSNSKNILKKYFGYDDFRKGQEEIIKDVLKGRDVLAIMPTGAGKSICFQVPAILFEGITIVISPLISLMKDQVDNLNELGVKATYINSSLTEKQTTDRIYGILTGMYKLVYIAPERLESSNFCALIKDVNISFIAIDEAHCISQWAHDFRTSYKKISKFIEFLDTRPVIGAYTATATEVVKNDIIKLLKLNEPKVYVTGFDRKNLYFSVLRGENNQEYILSYVLKHKDSNGIIYAATRKETEYIYKFLVKNNVKVGLYHAGLSDKKREEVQNKFAYDDINVMVATNAFGMGIDKSNVRYVIHNNMPKNLEAYYQEAGRAGRDGEKSECILLFNPRDIQLQTYFIEETCLSIERKTNEYEKLRSITDYCYTSQCLRKYILEYFGENVNYDNCNNCGNCNDESTDKDISLEAKKIFSCVYRMKEKYGTHMITDVLKGSKNKKVIVNGLNKLSTYGLMKEYDKKFILNIINKLAADGYLRLTNDGYPVVKLTNRAIEALKDNTKIFIKIPKVIRKIQGYGELFVILKSIRKEISETEKIPPYIVFADASLNEMATNMPKNKKEFLNIKGVGELKYNKYGEKFLKAISVYMKEKSINQEDSIDLRLDNKAESKKEILVNDGEKSKKTPSYIITYEMFVEGNSLDKIKDIRNISLQTVQEHIVKCKEEGKDVNIKDFIPEKYINLISNTIVELNTHKLKLIKDALPEEVEYFWIKLVRCTCENN